VIIPAAITLLAMIIVYGACSFGQMTRIAAVYFMLAFVNAALYPTFDGMPLQAIHTYGSIEALIKASLVLHVGHKFFDNKREYWPLIFLSVLHIINHAFIETNFGAYNDAIIYMEMGYLIWRSEDVVATTIRHIRSPNFWSLGLNRSYH